MLFVSSYTDVALMTLFFVKVRSIELILSILNSFSKNKQFKYENKEHLDFVDVSLYGNKHKSILERKPLKHLFILGFININILEIKNLKDFC